MGCCRGGLRPSEVVRQTIPDPAEQAPLVARSVTPPSPSGRGGTTLLQQAACTSILYRVCYESPPMNTPVREGETIEGSRTMRNRPYQVLKIPEISSCECDMDRGERPSISVHFCPFLSIHDQLRSQRARAGLPRDGRDGRCCLRSGCRRCTSQRWNQRCINLLHALRRLASEREAILAIRRRCA